MDTTPEAPPLLGIIFLLIWTGLGVLFCFFPYKVRDVLTRWYMYQLRQWWGRPKWYIAWQGKRLWSPGFIIWMRFAGGLLIVSGIGVLVLGIMYGE